MRTLSDRFSKGKDDGRYHPALWDSENNEFVILDKTASFTPLGESPVVVEGGGTVDISVIDGGNAASTYGDENA